MTPRVGVAPLRREQIVRATIRCLARDGYAVLTMKRVAAEARLSQGILHYYFPDKQAILAAAALRVTADLDRRVAAEARGARVPAAGSADSCAPAWMWPRATGSSGRCSSNSGARASTTGPWPG